MAELDIAVDIEDLAAAAEELGELVAEIGWDQLPDHLRVKLDALLEDDDTTLVHMSSTDGVVLRAEPGPELLALLAELRARA